MTVRIVVTGKVPDPGVEVAETIGEVWAWTDDEPIPHDIRDEQLATADAVVTLLTDTVDEAFLGGSPAGNRRQCCGGLSTSMSGYAKSEA